MIDHVNIAQIMGNIQTLINFTSNRHQTSVCISGHHKVCVDHVYEAAWVVGSWKYCQRCFSTSCVHSIIVTCNNNNAKKDRVCTLYCRKTSFSQMFSLIWRENNKMKWKREYRSMKEVARNDWQCNYCQRDQKDTNAWSNMWHKSACRTFF